MILCGKLDHQLSLEIVNLLTLFQTQPCGMQLRLKCTLKCPFIKKKKKLKLSLVEIASFHIPTLKEQAPFFKGI